MSKHYRETKPENMRDYCKRPGKTNKDGSPMYTTEQSHKNECDVTQIIKKFDKTGIITHIQNFEAKYGDMTGGDFREAQNLIIDAQKKFDALPSGIRKRFENDPSQLLSFMEDKENRKEALKLGLINPNLSEQFDGLGEYVTKAKLDKALADLKNATAAEPKDATAPE